MSYGICGRVKVLIRGDFQPLQRREVNRLGSKCAEVNGALIGLRRSVVALEVERVGVESKLFPAPSGHRIRYCLGEGIGRSERESLCSWAFVTEGMRRVG